MATKCLWCGALHQKLQLLVKAFVSEPRSVLTVGGGGILTIAVRADALHKCMAKIRHGKSKMCVIGQAKPIRL
jgi:hypothetical protein